MYFDYSCIRLYFLPWKIPNPNPAEVTAGRTSVYDTWLEQLPELDSSGSPVGKPR